MTKSEVFPENAKDYRRLVLKKNVIDRISKELDEITSINITSMEETKYVLRKLDRCQKEMASINKQSDNPRKHSVRKQLFTDPPTSATKNERIKEKVSAKREAAKIRLQKRRRISRTARRRMSSRCLAC